MLANGEHSFPALDDLPDGVIVADESGRVTVCNRVAARLLGIPAAEVPGKALPDALPLEDLDGRPWWTCLDPYGGLATRSGSPERALLLPGGREVLVTARFVRERPLGAVRWVVIGLRDGSARARQDRSRAELISTVSHELRSPLTSVKGFTATLLAKWDRFTDEQKRLMLETVDADADRVIRLVTDLLDVARIDSGRLDLRRELVDLPAAVSRHVAGIVASGVPPYRFAIEVSPPLPELWADADKLDQVIANLLENAIRHGAGRVTVRVEANGPDGLAMTVSDQGDGIPEDQRRRAFARFWRGSRRGGTGLGLYIVHGLVHAHDGTVSIDRAPEGGARFRVTLPCAAPEPGTGAAAPR